MDTLITFRVSSALAFTQVTKFGAIVNLAIFAEMESVQIQRSEGFKGIVRPFFQEQF